MSLAADTHMGRLELRVRDMPTMLAYYTDGVGLEPLVDEPGSVTLGHSQTPVTTSSPRRSTSPTQRVTGSSSTTTDRATSGSGPATRSRWPRSTSIPPSSSRSTWPG